MDRFSPIAVPLLALVLTACSEPAGFDPLMISVAVSRDKIVPGDTTTVVVRFTNTGPTSIDLPLFCQHVFEIADAQGEIVAGREGMACVAIVGGPTRLGPSESLELRSSWNGWFRQQIGDTLITGPLPPGRYRVYGKLEQRRSAPTTLELEPRVP
jgi:hypothetical protein